MSVALRCPSCGTTRDTAGQCDACHGADVRYFCDNHAPGAWLDGSTCERCGARFGESHRPLPPPAPRPAIRPPSRARPTPVPVEVAPRARPASPSRPPERAAVRPSPAPVSDEGAAPWPGLLGEALRRRSPETAVLPWPGLSRVRGLGGCLLRLAFVGLLLFIALIAALFFFARSLLKDFGGY